MKQRIIVFAFAGICLVLVASDTFGRGGRGGGGARPGGGYPGAGRPTGGMPGGAVHSYGGNVGGGAGNRVATVNPAVGPRGGTGATGKVGGSYTTRGAAPSTIRAPASAERLQAALAEDATSAAFKSPPLGARK
jgi:hypothetical protein